MSAAANPNRRSLVDSAEESLRNWLAPGRHRPGDRLPPEHDLASMLGVSRGTLRTALQRLEETGEIVRRQGSGTFVGRLAQPAALDEGLERLVSYSVLARERGITLSVRDLRIERTGVSAEIAAQFGVPVRTQVTTVSRVVLADGEPAVMMADTIHPDVQVPEDARLRRALERGDMVLDVLIAQAVPIAWSNTRIYPRFISGRGRAATALGVDRSTAVLELEETFHVTSGECVYHSRDLFAPNGLDLRVRRLVDATVAAVGDARPRRP